MQQDHGEPEPHEQAPQDHDVPDHEVVVGGHDAFRQHGHEPQGHADHDDEKGEVGV